MLALKATDVRKDWGGFIDSVVREKPQLVKRSRDTMMVIDIEMMKSLTTAYRFTANYFREEDDSITLSLNEIDLVVNGTDVEDARTKMALDLKEYADDYYAEFSYWSSSTNRKSQWPYVLSVLLREENFEELKEIIPCPVGKI